jgi:hypothetical protein
LFLFFAPKKRKEIVSLRQRKERVKEYTFGIYKKNPAGGKTPAGLL